MIQENGNIYILRRYLDYFRFMMKTIFPKNDD